jgi:3-oxoacyl-[acyl-carrier protein] reductase
MAAKTENAPVASPLFGLAGRVVIVTGGAKGLGEIYSRNLAALGAKVAIADIDPQSCAGLAGELAAVGGEALAVPTDVADAAAVRRMADATVARWGRVDCLVNNAALMSVLPRRPWHEIPDDEWDRVMAVNLKGVFLCCRAVYPHMKRQGGGKIVNVSSGRVFEGTPFRLHYTTSKAGIIGLTRALARELGADNIAVNALSPGLTLSRTQVESSDPKYIAAASEGRAFRRPQVPEDLIGALIFLLSDAANFMTGQTVNVDGGRAMH